MSQRLNSYLTQETSDYLSQLEQLLEQPGAADLERLAGLARGVRGSAQLAGAETLSAVAERLEDAVQSVVANHIVWSDDIRHLALQTVRDLQILVRALNRWGPAEESRVRTAIERWDDLQHVADPRLRLVAAKPVPIESLFFDDAGPHIVSTGTPVVPVESLLLRGDDAVRAAVEMREALESELRARGALDGAIAETLSDLFGLLEQASPAPSAT